MSHLYEIANDYIALQQLEDMPADAIANTMEGIRDDFDNKAVMLIKITLNLQSQAKAVQQEIDRLEKVKRQLVKRDESLKDYLRENMERTGITKIEHPAYPAFRISLGKAQKVVDVLNVDEIPDEYMYPPEPAKPNKKTILEALKKGIQVCGATLKDGKSRLTMK